MPASSDRTRRWGRYQTRYGDRALDGDAGNENFGDRGGEALKNGGGPECPRHRTGRGGGEDLKRGKEIARWHCRRGSADGLVYISRANRRGEDRARQSRGAVYV